uniref:Metalloprotease TIKI homolog n=1 Tax=Macrostomum lignano TaxID=282301 RepID=A0A1I8JBZ7_9PLAT
RRGQQVLPLESAQDQCRPLNSVPRDEAALALRLTLQHLEQRLEANQFNGGNKTSDLVSDYRCGRLGPAVVNASFLPDEAVRSLSGRELLLYQRLARRLRKSLMRLRDLRMAERIQRRLGMKEGQSMLFAVGVGHLLPSEHSVVAHLRSANFSLQLLPWNDTEQRLDGISGTFGPSNNRRPIEFPSYPNSRW